MTGDRRWSSGKFRAASLIDCNWSARHVQLDTTEEAKAKADRLGTEEWRRGSKPREPREWVSGRWRRQLCANYRLMRRTIATVRTVSLCLSLPLFLWFKDVCQRHFWAGVNWIPVQVRWWWMGSRLWLHTGLTTSFSTVLLSHSLHPHLSLSLSDFAHLIYRAGKLKLRTLLLWTMNCRNATEESQSQSQSELELEL